MFSVRVKHHGVLLLLSLMLSLLPDDDNYLDSSIQDVREIKLTFNKVKVTDVGMKLPKSKGVKSSKQRETLVLQPAKIHERAKKGLAHQIKLAARLYATVVEVVLLTLTGNYRYGDVAPRRAPVPYMHHCYKDLGIMATFVFRYRPLG